VISEMYQKIFNFSDVEIKKNALGATADVIFPEKISRLKAVY
jgi:hypothetical protein